MDRTEATADTLAVRRAGSGRGVMFLHGFAQTGGCGGPLVEDLSRDHLVRCPDAPGHGGSARHAEADLWATADLLARTVTADRAASDDAAGVDVIGYSMGARTALHLALAHPGAVRSLVLVGGTAGLDDPTERAARRAGDEALAAHLVDVGVDAFLDEWLTLPLFAGLPDWARFDDERRTNTAEGLAGSLRRCGTGAMDPLWGRLGGLAVPTLCIAGEDDPKFVALAARVASAMGGPAEVAVVGGSGHAVHLERPDAVVAAVRTHLGNGPV